MWCVVCGVCGGVCGVWLVCVCGVCVCVCVCGEVGVRVWCVRVCVCGVCVCVCVRCVFVFIFMKCLVFYSCSSQNC